MASIEEILDLNEAARIAGVTPARLRQLIEAGQLRGKKIGNSWAIMAADLDSLVGRSREPGRPDERKALESRLRVELRPMSPIQISLLPYNPEIRLWFRVDNRTEAEVELDRLLVEVWYPQPVADGGIFDRYTIGPNQLIDTPNFHAWLPPDKVEMMRRAAVDSTQYAELQIYVRAYFNTLIGTAHVAARITKQKGEFPIQLPPA
jgi:hypothetical protein